ncbi:MAG: iron ABC transporter permease [Desulfobacteraceae bacterium]|nr:iron ABC transporter permease [Desulfobacteraceae bacterium]
MKKFTLISALTVFAVVALVPVVWIIIDSLIHNGHLSLESYTGILAEDRQITLFSNSIILALGTAFFSLVIGLPLAFLVERTDLYLNRYFKYLYFIPLIIPPHVNAIAWIYLLGTKGHLNLLMEKIFLLKEPFFSIYGIKGATLVLTLSYFPIITMLSISGLNSVDRRMEEAGMLICNRFHVLIKITFPLIMPNIIAGTILVVIFSISDYGVPSLLRLNTYPVEIFARFSAFYDSKGAVALSLPLIIVIFVLTGLQHWYMKNRPYITIGTDIKKNPVLNLKNWKIPASGFVIFIILLSIIIPISALVTESGSIVAYKTAFKTAWGQILNSFVLSLAAASSATVLGFFISYTLEKTEWPGRNLTDYLCFIPFAIPASILGIGLIKVWNRPSTGLIYTSFIIIIFAYTARFSVFSIRSVSANLRQINTNMEEAAIISDGSWIMRLLKILIPLARPGLTAGWVITFIFCMGELGVTLLVVPPGKETLSVRIYSLMHYGAGNLVACLCLILIIITLIPVSILVYFNSNNDRIKKSYKKIWRNHSS